MLLSWLRHAAATSKFSSFTESTSRRSSLPRRLPARLRLEQLEERLAPVIGVYDVPYAIDTNAVVNNINLTSVVDVDGECTGAVIAAGGVVAGSRYILTAAHCMNVPGPLTQNITVYFYL